MGIDMTNSEGFRNVPSAIIQENFDNCKKIVKKMIKEVTEDKDSYFSLSDKKSVKFLFDKKLYIKPKIQLISGKPIVIIGEGGYGKSLFLIKKFIERAQCFLNDNVYHSDISIPFYCQVGYLGENIKTVSSFIENTYKESFDDKIHFNVSFYLDGLDELKQNFYDFIKTDIFKSSVLITSREHFYNKYKHKLLDFFPHNTINIGKWNDKETKRFIEKYCHQEKIDETEKKSAIDFICRKSKNIFSPFLVSLFLYVIKEKLWENKKDDSLIEVSILKSAMKEYISREIDRNEDRNIDIEKVFSIISEACWLHYKYNHPKYRNTKYTYPVSYKDEISRIFSIDEEIADRYIKIVLKEEELDRVVFTMHEKINEFLIAKRIVDNIIRNKENDDVLSLNYKPEVIWYIVDLCRYDENNVRVANFCKEKYDRKFSCANFQNYADMVYLTTCIILYSRLASPGPEEFIEEQLNNKLLTTHAIQFALYDSIIQYSKIPSIRQKYEEIFYNKLCNEDDFEKVHRGSRLLFYNCEGVKVDYVIKGDQGGCDWRSLFDEIKKHFQEKKYSDKHYISRRIELITISKLLGENHTNNKNPDFMKELKDFLLAIKPELYEKAEKAKNDDDFDKKVKKCYDSFFSDGCAAMKIIANIIEK